jgi:hypothetical protein
MDPPIAMLKADGANVLRDPEPLAWLLDAEAEQADDDPYGMGRAQRRLL